jgi:hypothetical protein
MAGNDSGLISYDLSSAGSWPAWVTTPTTEAPLSRQAPWSSALRTEMESPASVRSEMRGSLTLRAA